MPFATPPELFPSHAIIRSSRLTTSAAKYAEQRLALLGGGARGSPMWPGSLRSCVTQAA